MYEEAFSDPLTLKASEDCVVSCFLPVEPFPSGGRRETLEEEQVRRFTSPLLKTIKLCNQHYWGAETFSGGTAGKLARELQGAPFVTLHPWECGGFFDDALVFFFFSLPMSL